jgi:hypothetical protein
MNHISVHSEVLQLRVLVDAYVPHQPTGRLHTLAFILYHIIHIYIPSSHTVCHLLVPSDSSFMYGLRFSPVLFNTGFAFPHTCFLPAPVHSALVAAFASLSLYIFFYCPRLKSDLTLWRVGAPLFRGGRWCSRQIVSHTFYLLLLTTSVIPRDTWPSHSSGLSL